MTPKAKPLGAGLLLIGLALIGVSCAPQPIVEETKVDLSLTG